MAHTILKMAIALTVMLAACTTTPMPEAATPMDQPLVIFTPTARAAATIAPPPTAAPTAAATPAKIQYTIRPGDTLLAIAWTNHVSMAAIQLANDLNEGDMIRAGQSLDIPTGPQWDGELPYWVVHIVKSGETLVGIAQSFGVTTRDILRVNAIADPGLIRPGQPIVIPLDSLHVATLPPTPRPTPVPSPVPTVAALRSSAALSTTPSARRAAPTVLPTVVPATIPSDIAVWPAAVVTLINQKRAAHGLPPYSMAPELMHAAQAHADDCAARGWCGHVGSDGADTKSREIRAGYHPTAWGENWVQALGPTKAVEWWYNETPPNDPHRQNLLHTRYSEIGIGIAQGGYGYYFIADFGKQ